MATKTFEELKQMAIQIRDEKTNKQNTATRIGTQMLEHLNKLEQEYYDKTTLDKRVTELNISELYPTQGIGGTNKYDLATAIALVDVKYRTIVGLKISFINNETSDFETWIFKRSPFSSTSSWVREDGYEILSWVGDAATTRKQVPQLARKEGLRISYKPEGEYWVNEQYVGTTFTDAEWGKSANWEAIPNQTQISDINKSISDISGISTYVAILEDTQRIIGSLPFNLKNGDSVNISITFKVAIGSSLYLYLLDQEGTQVANLGSIAAGLTEKQLTYKTTKDLTDIYLQIVDFGKNTNTYTTVISYPSLLTELNEEVYGISEKMTGVLSSFTTIETDGSFSNRVPWTKVGSYDIKQGGVYRYSILGDVSFNSCALMSLYKDDTLVSVLQLADGSLRYEGLLNIDVDANKLFVNYASKMSEPEPFFYDIQKKSLNDKIYLLEEELKKKLDADSDLLKTDWEGKTIAFYGDSITEFYEKGDANNGTYPFYDDSIYKFKVGWCTQVAKYFRCKQIHVRGIGAQKFAWGNTGGWTCFINNETGAQKSATYTEYPNKANECPEGYTVTRGCACSWLRIINQFPEKIKDNVDAVLIMYHNDVGLDDSVKEEEFQFIPEDKTDEEWASSEYYSKYNGDFNIKTVRGGIASTIMKFQAWMPNARLILCTPMSTAVDSDTIGEDNTATTTDLSYTLKMYKVAQAVKDVAEKLSIPLIDVFHNDGINPFNRTPYVEDFIHPGTAAGCQRTAITIIGGMKTILPNPEPVE